jgi:hypothetical protein
MLRTPGIYPNINHGTSQMGHPIPDPIPYVYPTTVDEARRGGCESGAHKENHLPSCIRNVLGTFLSFTLLPT